MSIQIVSNARDEASACRYMQFWPVKCILQPNKNADLAFPPLSGQPLHKNGHGFIGYPKGRNVERALGSSLTGTVSTSPNLAKEGARSATIITRPSGSRFS